MIVVACAVAGDPFMVEDLSGNAMGQRTYDGSGFGYQPNGDQVRVFLRVGSQLLGREIDIDQQQITGTLTQGAQELMWARPVGSNIFGLLVARPMVGAGYPLDLLAWPSNQNLATPVVYPISAGTLTSASTNSPRGLFVHAGNQPDNIGSCCARSRAARTACATPDICLACWWRPAPPSAGRAPMKGWSARAPSFATATA